MMQDRVKPTTIKSLVLEDRRTKSCGKLIGGTEPLFGTTTLGDTIRPEFVPALDFTKIREKQQRTNVKDKWVAPPLPSLARRKSDVANPCFSIPSELQQHLHDANSFSGALPFLDRGVVTTNMYNKYGEKVASQNLTQSLEELNKKSFMTPGSFQRKASTVGSSVSSKKGSRRRLTSERSKSETKLSTISSNLSKSNGVSADLTNNLNMSSLNCSTSSPPASASSKAAPPFIKNASYSMAPPPLLPAASRSNLNITKATLNDSVKGASKKLTNSNRPHGEKASLAMTLVGATNSAPDNVNHNIIHTTTGNNNSEFQSENNQHHQPIDSPSNISAQNIIPRRNIFISTCLGPTYWFAEQLSILNPFVMSKNQSNNSAKRIEIPLVMIPLCNRCGKCLLPFSGEGHGCSCEALAIASSKIRWTGYAGVPDTGSILGTGHGMRKATSWRSNSNASITNNNTNCTTNNNANITSLTSKLKGTTIPIPGSSPPVLGTVVMLSDTEKGLSKGESEKLKSGTLKMVDYIQKFTHCMQAAGHMGEGKPARRPSAWYRLQSGNSSRSSKSDKNNNASLGSFIKRRDSWSDICRPTVGIVSKIVMREDSGRNNCICQLLECGEMETSI